MDEKIKDKDAERKDATATDLDEGLEETFPGSDPVSANQPGSRHDAPKPPKPSDDQKR